MLLSTFCYQIRLIISYFSSDELMTALLNQTEAKLSAIVYDIIGNTRELTCIKLKNFVWL